MTNYKKPFEYKSYLSEQPCEDLFWLMNEYDGKSHTELSNAECVVVSLNDGPTPTVDGYVVKGFVWDPQVIGTIWIWAQMKGGLEEYGSLYLVHAESGFVIKKRPVVIGSSPNPRSRMLQAFVRAIAHHAKNRFEDISIHQTMDGSGMLLSSPWEKMNVEYLFKSL